MNKVSSQAPDSAKIHHHYVASARGMKDFSLYAVSLRAMLWLAKATQIEVPVMTYESAIKYFVRNRPSDHNIKKGAIFRQRYRNFQIIDLLFLDQNDHPVYKSDGNYYGSRFLVNAIDDELQNAFDDQDIIIVE